MIIDAADITDWQACRRKGLLSHDWRYMKWRPSALWIACFREAVIAMSNGTPTAEAATIARGTFMQAAANPGLEFLHSPHSRDVYRIAKDWCAMLSTALEATARQRVPLLRPVDSIRLSPAIEWRPLSRLGADGQLHRWIACDRWDTDDLARALHGWYVIGDIAATRRPMMLHVIEIGQMRNGRQASHWARGWKHPKMPRLRVRFKRRGEDHNPEADSDLKGFRPWFMSDNPDISVAEWVDQMEHDDVIRDVTHTVPVGVPSDAVCADVLRQVLQEASAMRDAITERGSLGWDALPMSRGACDWPVPCVWQQVCYAAEPRGPGAMPELYQIRKATTAYQSLPVQTPHEPLRDSV